LQFLADVPLSNHNKEQGMQAYKKEELATLGGDWGSDEEKKRLDGILSFIKTDQWINGISTLKAAQFGLAVVEAYFSADYTLMSTNHRKVCEEAQEKVDEGWYADQVADEVLDLMMADPKTETGTIVEHFFVSRSLMKILKTEAA
jgi:hypothetical protein